MKKGLNVLDLFCGAGGLSEGFKQAGFNILLGIDNDESALRTFKLNHSESEFLNKDISKITRKDLISKTKNKKIDFIIGGPPCQGFSMAGRRNPNDPRNFLIKHFLRIVSLIKPKIFVIENVQGLKSMRTEKGELFLDLVRKKSNRMKYNLQIHILNAEEYGVPQKRKRIFLIGSLKPINIALKKSKKSLLKNILLKKEDVPKKYFYSNKMIKGFKKRAIINKKLGRGFGWRFLNPEDTSYTISARYYKDGAEALIKYSEKEIRRLTLQECAIIQSFPKTYKFEEGIIKTYKQIGNAVPPMLALNIANAIKGEI